MSEESQIFNDGERAKRLKENEDWKWAKHRLEELINTAFSLATLPNYKTATALQREVETRQKAAGLILTWFEEVEGTGVQRDFHKEKPLTDNGMITRFEEPI